MSETKRIANTKQIANQKLELAEEAQPIDITIDRVLDVRTYQCPLPLLKAKLAMNELAGGQVLKVLTIDRGSLRDFPAFSRLSGHTLLWSGESAGICVHILRKKGED